MARIVKKFGGTSLQTRERIELAVDDVADSLEDEDQVIVVVSAMGREGDPYATDNLIGLLEEVSPEIDPLVKDLMMSNGEVISAVVFAHHLRSRGYQAVPMTGPQAGIFTTDDFGDARITDMDPARMEGIVRNGKPVVLAGFQGRTVRNEITTLGRGGSDTTAVTVGGYLDADLVEIFTDVPGVAAVDPSLVEDPPFFSSVPRDSLLALAQFGASVIHPRAVKNAEEYEVPFSIKCRWDDSGKTVVGDEPAPVDTPMGIAMIDGLAGLKGSYESLVTRFDQEKVVRIDEGNGILPLSGDVDGGEERFEKLGNLALVTAVSTRPGDTDHLVQEIGESISDRDYLGRRVLSNGVQYLVDQEVASRVIKRAYDSIYV